MAANDKLLGGGICQFISPLRLIEVASTGFNRLGFGRRKRFCSSLLPQCYYVTACRVWELSERASEIEIINRRVYFYLTLCHFRAHPKTQNPNNDINPQVSWPQR